MCKVPYFEQGLRTDILSINKPSHSGPRYLTLMGRTAAPDQPGSFKTCATRPVVVNNYGFCSFCPAIMRNDRPCVVTRVRSGNVIGFISFVLFINVFGFVLDYCLYNFVRCMLKVC